MTYEEWDVTEPSSSGKIMCVRMYERDSVMIWADMNCDKEYGVTCQMQKQAKGRFIA